MSTKASDYYDERYSITKMYERMFNRHDQAEIRDEDGEDAICENCGEPVYMADFRTAGDLEAYCCGCGNDEGFCQRCQDELLISK